MKLIMTIVLFAISLVSQAQIPEAQEIARIKSRSSSAEIVYLASIKGHFFYLTDGKNTVLINRLNFGSTQKIESTDGYSFELTKSLVSMTGKAYHWCWSLDNDVVVDDDIGQNAFLGLKGAFIGIAGTIGLCASLPVVPAVVGVALAPVDGVVTLANNFFSTDAIASRKFSKLIKGHSSKANAKVFGTLVLRISQL